EFKEAAVGIADRFPRVAVAIDRPRALVEIQPHLDRAFVVARGAVHREVQQHVPLSIQGICDGSGRLQVSKSKPGTVCPFGSTSVPLCASCQAAVNSTPEKSGSMAANGVAYRLAALP